MRVFLGEVTLASGLSTQLCRCKRHVVHIFGLLFLSTRWRMSARQSRSGHQGGRFACLSRIPSSRVMSALMLAFLEGANIEIEHPLDDFVGD